MFGDFAERHERLKKRIHSFRIPLSPRGQVVMKVVYFSLPMIFGVAIMNMANEESQKNMLKYGIGSNPNGVRKKEVAEQNQALQAVLNKYKSNDP